MMKMKTTIRKICLILVKTSFIFTKMDVKKVDDNLYRVKFRDRDIYISTSSEVLNYIVLNELFDINLSHPETFDEIKRRYPNLTNLHDFINRFNEIINEKPNIKKTMFLCILSKINNILLLSTLAIVLIVVYIYININAQREIL